MTSEGGVGLKRTEEKAKWRAINCNKKASGIESSSKGGISFNKEGKSMKKKIKV